MSPGIGQAFISGTSFRAGALRGAEGTDGVDGHNGPGDLLGWFAAGRHHAGAGLPLAWDEDVNIQAIYAGTILDNHHTDKPLFVSDQCFDHYSPPFHLSSQILRNTLRLSHHMIGRRQSPNQIIQDVSAFHLSESARATYEHDYTNRPLYTLMCQLFGSFEIVDSVLLCKLSGLLAGYSGRSRHGGRFVDYRLAGDRESVGAWTVSLVCIWLNG